MTVLNIGINTMYLTISELNTINDPIYNIIIVDETTKIEKTITLLDTTIYAVRYNKFNITVVDDINDEDLANGIVYLNDGTHSYTVKTINKITPFNSDICELGLVKVLRASTPKGSAYSDTIADQEYISYTGNINQNI